MKQKFFPDHNAAAEKLFQDVGENNVRIYDVAEYERIANLSIHPPRLIEKWSQVIVATSGDLSSCHQWMVVAPYRADTSKATDKKYIDIDPLLFVLDNNSGSSHPSGVVAYHQTFTYRTKEISGYEDVNVKEAVDDLRSKVITGLAPLETAPPEVLSALHHMVEKFRVDFTGSNE